MPDSLNTILLPYQRRWIADLAPVKVYEKSRRIGATWSEAADAAADAAAKAGSDWWYIGYNKDMALEFIEEASRWARRIAAAAAAIEEVAIADQDKDILAYRIRFASGNKIVALSSRPSNLRGKQGVAIIDEAAFHDDLAGLLKAALAFTMWGGRVHIISTHNGADNPFNELVTDVCAGRRPYSLHRTTIDDAIKDGLFRAICRVRSTRAGLNGSHAGGMVPAAPESAREGITNKDGWSLEAEQRWRDQVFADYGDDADEELLCIPNQSCGVFLPSVLIESRMVPDIPILRWECPYTFIERGNAALYKDAEDWIRTYLEPLLNVRAGGAVPAAAESAEQGIRNKIARIDPNLMSCFGMDFGRSGDLTVIWPMQIGKVLVRRTPFVLELRNVPFKQQEQILFYLVDHLPRFIGGAMDARGNGQYLAETAQLRYGSRLEAVMLSQEWYRENMPKYKAAFEDADLELPKDPEILADHRMLKMEKGVAKIPERRIRGQGGATRHGDSAIAGALAWYASQTDHQEYAYTPVAASFRRNIDDAPPDDDDAQGSRAGFFRSRFRFGRGSW